jgi:hypothetical protein
LGRKLSQFFFFFVWAGPFNYDKIFVADNPLTDFKRGTTRVCVILIMGRKNYRTLCQRAQSRDLSNGKFSQGNLKIEYQVILSMFETFCFNFFRTLNPNPFTWSIIFIFFSFGENTRVTPIRTHVYTIYCYNCNKIFIAHKGIF